MRHPRLFGAILVVAAIASSLLIDNVQGDTPRPERSVAPEYFSPVIVPATETPYPTVSASPVSRLYDFPEVAATERPVVRTPEPKVVHVVVKPKPKPKPKPRVVLSGHSIKGQATYYCWPGHGSICMAAHPNGGMYAAAGPALRAAICGSSTSNCWRGRRVTVTGPDGTVTVTLADWCACGGGHLIDLYHDVLVLVTDNPWGAIVTVRW